MRHAKLGDAAISWLGLRGRPQALRTQPSSVPAVDILGSTTALHAMGVNRASAVLRHLTSSGQRSTPGRRPRAPREPTCPTPALVVLVGEGIYYFLQGLFILIALEVSAIFEQLRSQVVGVHVVMVVVDSLRGRESARLQSVPVSHALGAVCCTRTAGPSSLHR